MTEVDQFISSIAAVLFVKALPLYADEEEITEIAKRAVVAAGILYDEVREDLPGIFKRIPNVAGEA